MKNKVLAIIIYGILGLILAAFIFFTLSSAFSAPFIVELQREIIKSTTLTTIDIDKVSQWGMIISAVILVALLVIFDERDYRKEINKH